MSKVKKERYYTKYLTINQGDLLLIDYGKTRSGCRTGVVRPSIVVSNNETLKMQGRFFVIPLYRSPSRSAGTEDILIREVDCSGLRYEEYANASNMFSCPRCRVIRRIGHIRNDRVMKEITLSLWDMVGHDAS